MRGYCLKYVQIGYKSSKDGKVLDVGSAESLRQEVIVVGRGRHHKSSNLMAQDHLTRLAILFRPTSRPIVVGTMTLQLLRSVLMGLEVIGCVWR